MKVLHVSLEVPEILEVLLMEDKAQRILSARYDSNDHTVVCVLGDLSVIKVPVGVESVSDLEVLSEGSLLRIEKVEFATKTLIEDWKRRQLYDTRLMLHHISTGHARMVHEIDEESEHRISGSFKLTFE